MGQQIARSNLGTAADGTRLTPKTPEALGIVLRHVTLGQQHFGAPRVLYYFNALFVMLSLVILTAME